MKKILLLTLSLITSLTLAGQYPATGNKLRLGFQTTGDGLVYRGTISDTSTLDPSSINNAWMLLDTTNGALFIYKSKAWKSITMPFDSVTFNVNEEDASIRELKYSEEKGYLQYGGQDSVQIPLLPGIWYIRNDTSITIPAGTVVRASGTLGGSGRIKVKHMIADGSIPAMYVLGIAMQDIATGADGYVMTQGKIRQVNTTAYSEGAVLYADVDTLGGLTQTEPGNGYLKLPIAFVVHSASNGTLAVRIDAGASLRDLHDVDTSGRVSGSVLRYDAILKYWKASTSPGVLAADTASMLTPYLKKQDTVSLSDRIDLKLNISDTSSMLTNYINVEDTTSMLLPYLRKSQMSGTATYLPKYATDSTLTNSIIRESNSKIGIGTSASSSYTINVANSDTGPGTAGGMYIGLTSAKTIANKGLVVATGSGASNYTGIETSALGGTFNSIGLLASGNGFGGGTNAIGGQFSATNATNNYAIEISSGTATDSLSYAIYSSSVAKTYLNGKLGLGTTTPDSALTVNGGFRTVNDANINGVRVGRGLGNISTNTVVGSSALNSNTTGLGNIALGIRALRDNTAGAYNIGVGLDAGESITTGNRNSFLGAFSGGTPATNMTGNDNTGIGYQALYANTTGADNVAVGAYSLDANTTGGINTAVGNYSLYTNTTGQYNVGVGYGSLFLNTTGTKNIGIGYNSLRSNTTASNNVAIGDAAGYTNQTGTANTLVGTNAGYNNTGTGNSFFGLNSGISNTTGGYNAFFGTGAGGQTTTGNYNVVIGGGASAGTTASSNTVVGVEAGGATTTGGSNVYIGRSSGQGNTTGIINVGIGLDAGRYTNSGADNQTTNYSVYLGASARSSASGNSNEIVLGYDARGQGSNSIMLGNSSIANLYCYDTSISSPSDERDKKNVETLEIGLDFILGLRPVAFDWNMRDGGKKDIPDVGFIAQEVEPLQNILPQGDNLNVVHYQAQDDRYFMQSANLIPVLVKAIQEQQSQIQTLKQEIEILKSQINK